MNIFVEHTLSSSTAEINIYYFDKCQTALKKGSESAFYHMLSLDIFELFHLCQFGK